MSRVPPSEGFHGRRKGKSLRPLQRETLEAVEATHGLDLAEAFPGQAALFPVPVTALRVEIGFGGGEHLHAEASRNPEIGYVGAEPFQNGRAKLAEQLLEKPRPNIRFYHDNALDLLAWLPEASVEQLDLLYPDPWPKTRHWKRRFVSQDNLTRIARVLIPGGRFRFASDIDHYVNWTLWHCARHPCFEWTAKSAKDWNDPWTGWPGTRYEAKALREGRKPAYLVFERLGG